MQLPFEFDLHPKIKEIKIKTAIIAVRLVLTKFIVHPPLLI